MQKFVLAVTAALGLLGSVAVSAATVVTIEKPAAGVRDGNSGCPDGHWALDKPIYDSKGKPKVGAANQIRDCVAARPGYFVKTGLTPNNLGIMGQRAEVPCTPGTYSTGKASSCTSAPPGHFAKGSAATAPTPCPPGEYAPGTGKYECLIAVKGEYVEKSGSASVQRCPPGKTTEKNLAKSASQCIPQPKEPVDCRNMSPADCRAKEVRFCKQDPKYCK